MTPYQTLTQPWRQAVAVWTVLAQAQTDFALRMMGLTAPRTVARRPSSVPVAVLPPVSEPVAEVPAEEEAPDHSAEVVPLRLVTEASAPAIAAATAPEVEALPEPEPEAAPFVAEEEPLAVLAEPAPQEDLVQATVQSFVEETAAAVAELRPEPATARPARRAASGTRRPGKIKRGS
ncbi:hypothetical protein [Rubellimicrobium mesophilum]|nr:hypothetical protein [Rubellimicrobium mesophilum]